MSHIVLLACGHWFREDGSGRSLARLAPQVRTCERDGHRAGVFAAVYVADRDLTALEQEYP